MNANSLKAVYEKFPRFLKFAFAPVFVRQMVDNAMFVGTFKDITHFEALSAAEREQEQLKMLKETLVYAYENVPFYKDRFDNVSFDPYSIQSASELKQVPILKKREAIEAKERLYSTEEGLDFYETFTGGSSGQVLRVLLDKKSVYTERAYICHFLAKHGYDLHKTKTVAFWGHNKAEDYYYSPLKNEIVISPFRLYKQSEFEGICRDIEKFGVEFIAGYPSAIFTFAQMARRAQRRLKFKQAVFYAENYTVEEKKYIEETFSCGAISYYGHTERAVFAEILDDECIFKDSYGYTELVPTETANEYRIVCTGFLSRKMPLIRYATDDVVLIDEDGKKYLVGHKRSEVHLLAKNGARIFKGAMTLHIPDLDSIVRYQYIQDEVGKAVLNLMTARSLTDEELSALRAYLDRRVEGLLDIDIQQVDSINLTDRGKERWAVCNIPKEKLAEFGYGE